MKNVLVKDLMSVQMVAVDINTTLQKAAEKMKEVDCGMLPVGSKDTLLGVITDRDIVIRAIAAGKDPSKEKVRDYMTEEVFSCNENDFLEDAANKMKMHKVSRLVVKDKLGSPVGVLSFGGILRKDAGAEEVANIVKYATRISSI